MNFKKYLMDDGTYLTTRDVADATGVSRIAAYRRLLKSSSKDYVLSMKGSELMTDKARTGRPIGTSRWKDDKVQIAFGIPINPSYMDGVSHKGELPRNRDGNILSAAQRSALSEFRRRNRQQWRDEGKESILNVYDSHREEMDAIKRRRIK